MKCGKPDYVGMNHLPDLKCERCGGSLRVQVRQKNYVYICSKCQAQWLIADSVPSWSELFPYWGLAAPGDSGYT